MNVMRRLGAGVLALLALGHGEIPVRSAESASDVASVPTLKSIALEAGEVYEVRREYSVELFRFHKNGSFDIMNADGVSLLGAAEWKREGDNFRVSPKPDGRKWRAEGRVTKEGIEGTQSHDGLTEKFAGRRVDYQTYAFPLREDEVIVLLRMNKYRLWEGTEVDSEEFKKRQKELSEFEASPGIYGLEFEVLAPEELKGKRVGAHHDGDLASGRAVAIARPGKCYLWRTQRKNIGGRDFEVCSIALHWMKEADDLTPDPRYRPGLGLLKALEQAPGKNDPSVANKPGK